MLCFSCGALMPDTARFCPACGRPGMSAGATEQVTMLAPGATHRTPAGAARPPSSGWLTESDSISHGRFAPGALFDERYRIIGLLGRGGMGEVYRADDLRLGQQVALKFLPDDLRRDPVRLAQFHNEVRTARQLSHPNVCRVYDIGDADGVLYLSLEYVDGEDLATSVRRIGAPATLDGSAWYVGNMLLLIAIAVVLATWGLYTSVSGRLWRMDALG